VSVITGKLDTTILVVAIFTTSIGIIEIVPLLQVVRLEIVVLDFYYNR